MKILLVVVLIAIEAETYPGWPSYPGFQNARRNNLGHGSSWAYPQWTENQNNGFNSNIEWICRNPRTNDIVCTYIITTILKSLNAMFLQNKTSTLYVLENFSNNYNFSSTLIFSKIYN